MVLTKHINKTSILPDMKSRGKAEAIKELCHLLFDKKNTKTLTFAMDQIMAREATESTGIGRGIAVPHARIPTLKTLTCAVGRVPEGIDFLAVDRKPVHLVFLICYPPADQTKYLNFVATVAKLLRGGEHREAIVKAETADEMYSVLEEASEAFVDRHEEHPKKLASGNGIDDMRDTHADIILLARLQLCMEMLTAARTGKAQIRKRIENIRAMVEPKVISHFDRLMKSRAPAIVSVEGDTCQGCFMKLPSQFVQKVRLDPEHIHTCPNCSRYIYVV